MTPKLIAEAGTEPISVDEAGFNLRAAQDSNSPPTYVEAALIARLIKAARQACEQELQVSLVLKTLEIEQSVLCMNGLPQGPVRSIVSVTLIDTGGVESVIAADQYRVTGYGAVDMLLPAYGVTWPPASAGTMRVRYTAGYPSTDSPPQEVPEPIRQAMHLFIGHYFNNREAVALNVLSELPLGARYLLAPYRQGLGV